jgi:hypothetical protein
MTTEKKRKSPIAVALSDDLEAHLRDMAKANYRTLNGEIAIRLELSRKQEQPKTQGAQQ